jgi:hypothetical protein
MRTVHSLTGLQYRVYETPAELIALTDVASQQRRMWVDTDSPSGTPRRLVCHSSNFVSRMGVFTWWTSCPLSWLRLVARLSFQES